MILSSLRCALVLLMMAVSLFAQGKTFTASLPNGTQMEFVWIEPGTFVMGTTEGQEQLLRDKGLWDSSFEREQPAHQVTISKGFYLGVYEITQGQWESVMGTRPWSGQSYVQANPNNPAVYISWNDVQEFARKLNDAAGEVIYRLPTEAEWEYACRAGTSTLWSFGDEEGQLGDYSWYAGNVWNAGEDYAHAVGTKLPNPWGLFDMHGNVWEWCQDVFSESYYNSSPGVDPPGPPSGTGRVIRGGYFDYDPWLTRSAIRSDGGPGYREHDVGARLLRMEPKIPAPTPVIPKSWGQTKWQVFH